MLERTRPGEENMRRGMIGSAARRSHHTKASRITIDAAPKASV